MWKKTLSALALIVVASGCVSAKNDCFQEYRFSGRIGETTVESWCEFGPVYAIVGRDKAYIETTGPDGSKVIYSDLDLDLELDYVTTIIGENKTKFDAYSSNPAVQELFTKEGGFQDQYEWYLDKILEINSAPAGIPQD